MGDLPYEIIACLMLDEPVHFNNDQRPLAQRLRRLMKARGVSRLDLARMMQWSGNQTKTLRLIDSALMGEPSHAPLIRLAYKCLGVDDEDFAAILQEDQDFRKRRHENLLRRRAHQGFRMLGPHLRAVLWDAIDFEPRWIAKYRYLCAKVAYQSEASTIIPLGVQDVSSAIVANAKWLPRIAKSCVKAYIYHRLPEEIHVIDSSGKVLLSGDTQACRSDLMDTFLSSLEPGSAISTDHSQP